LCEIKEEENKKLEQKGSQTEPTKKEEKTKRMKR